MGGNHSEGLKKQNFDLIDKLLACECGATKQTARHILEECRLFNRQRRSWWVKERRNSPSEVIIYRKMLMTPPYTSMAADFIRSTGLIRQYQALNKDQQEGFTRV